MSSNGLQTFATEGGQPRVLRRMRRQGKCLVSAAVDETLRFEIPAL